MTAREMTFADEYRYEILDGQKTATVRIGWDDLVPSDYLLLQDESGELFARADIDVLCHTTALKAVETVATTNGKHDARKPGELIQRLNEHYDEEITAKTSVQVVVFEVRDDLTPDREVIRR